MKKCAYSRPMLIELEKEEFTNYMHYCFMWVGYLDAC